MTKHDRNSIIQTRFHQRVHKKDIIGAGYRKAATKAEQSKDT
jgi:hypothetical protein